MLCAYCLWTGRNLYCATPPVTWGLGFAVSLDLFCLFVWSFSYHSKFFYSFGDVTIADEGLQILTYAQHLWPLSSEGSLACHTSCNTGHPFIMVISEEPWDSYPMPSVWQWSCQYLFHDLGPLRLRFEHPTFRLQGKRSNQLRHRRGRSL